MKSQQLDNIAKTFAQAFYEDPLFVFFFPDADNREELSFYTFRFIAAHAARFGAIEQTSSDCEGVAIWLPHVSTHRSLLDQLRFGALTMLFKQGSAIIQRQISASDYMKGLQKQLVREPHYYLSTLGVKPSHRGKGLSRLLITPMITVADKEGVPCYLDTHNEANVSLYRHFGFQIVSETKIPGSSVTHWGMLRPAQN